MDNRRCAIKLNLEWYRHRRWQASDWRLRSGEVTPEDRRHNPAFRQGKIACSFHRRHCEWKIGAGKGVLIREQEWAAFMERSGSGR